MSLVMVIPMAVSAAMIIECNVPEADQPAYSAATTYALDDYCMDDHMVYQSRVAANTGNTPGASPTQWRALYPTNKYRCLDNSTTSQTTQALGMSYRLRPGRVVNCVAVLNAYADTVRVRLISASMGTVYDKTSSLIRPIRRSSWYDFFFSRRTRKKQVLLLDLPSYYDADVVVDFAVASGSVSAGVLMMGYQQVIGYGVHMGLRAGIDDYSRKATDEFGVTTLKELNFATKASLTAIAKNTEIDAIFEQLAEVRATVCLWIASDLYTCTAVFGWVANFELLIAYAMDSDYSIDLKGLT